MKLVIPAILSLACLSAMADPPHARRDRLVEMEANAITRDSAICRNKGHSKLRYSYLGGSTAQPECGSDGQSWVRAGEPRAAVTFSVPMPSVHKQTLPACVSVESRIYCEDLACPSGVLDIERAVCTNKIHIRSHR